MAKHLAKTEKKIKPEKPAREIRIPEIKVKKRPAAERETERRDPFQSAMLNKTLDRRFSASDLLLTLLALVLLIVASFLPTTGPVRLLSFIVPFLLAGWNYLYEAFQEAFMGIVLGRELIVTAAGLLALCAGAWFGAAAIMICLKIADMALAYVESKQSEKVSALYALQPDKAELVSGDILSAVDASELPVGAVVEVKEGAIVPADGVVVDGASVLDATALARVSFSFPVAAGSAAVSGCRNVGAPLRIRVERTQKDSVCSALIRSAENSWMHKSAHERMLQRVLSYLTPALVILAILMAVVPSIATGQW